MVSQRSESLPTNCDSVIPSRRIGNLWFLLAIILFSAAASESAASEPPPFSVQLPLQVRGAVDLRQWEKPFAFNLFLLADTTAAILSNESRQFKHTVEVDSLVQTIRFRQVLFDDDFLQPVIFDREGYIAYRLRTDLQELFRKTSLDKLKKPESEAGGEALTIEIPFKIKSKTFNKIFGGDRVRLRISGNINIEGGFRREDRSQVATYQGQEADYSFRIDQTQRFKIKGEIGDKVSVEVDQDSERMFEFENALKLTYTGYEDEIIQKIEAGNISLNLPGTQLATFSGQNKGLFGLKAEAKLGPFSLTTIASLEKGEKNKLTVTGGAQQTTVDIPVNSPSVGRYFFLGEVYREQYKIYGPSMEHTPVPDSLVIDKSTLVVYKRYTLGSGTMPDQLIYAYAVYDSTFDRTNPEWFYQKSTIDSLRADSLIADKEFQPGNYVPLDESQYTVNEQSGYIRLNTPLSNTDVLAVYYATNGGKVYGSLTSTQSDTSVLKLIRPDSPYFTDQTWPLTWRNVYSLQGANIEREGFSLKITYNPSGVTEMETIEYNGKQETFLTLFGFDTKTESGQSQPDGKIDDNPFLINYSYGELIFPDLRPFDPQEGYYIYDGLNLNYAPYWGDPSQYPDSLRFPSIYDSTQLISTNFSIKAEFKSVKAVYDLGFNVLEGSEEVYLGGRRLKKGSDYVIDYYSGTLTILNQAALSPSANLEIVYESGELFQLDKKTLLGIRGEYHLWDQSFIGATALYLNEKPLQDRVRIGNEPLRNFLWDVNARLVFKPKFLTKAVDYLPLVETTAPSEFKVEMEYAQVHPNPNSLNNKATGDANGVAYVDDFESIKRTSPLGIMRRQWRIASYPSFAPPGKKRGTFVWFNPYDQVSIKEIWPNRPTNANVAQRTHVLSIYFAPQASDTTYGPTKESEYAAAWGGIQRALSAGYHNQENSKYIEIMLRVKDYRSSRMNVPGKLHIDLGQISEDVIENGQLDTEDKPLGDLPYGDGFCDPEEDVGLDGRKGNDPNDWWDLNGDGIQDTGEPLSMDDWQYDPSDPYNVWHINGTEGNYNDEGGRYPDTEDLDNDNFLDTQKNFFRYTIDLSEIYPGASYGINPGGQWQPTPRWLVTEPNADGWKMYRIPLESAEVFGNPSLTQIQYARLWVDGFEDADTVEISIATLEIVGNEWEAVPIADPLTGNYYEPVLVEVINSYDDPNYKSPPGVSGERDPVTDIISQEQSLVLRVTNLPEDSVGMAVRRLYDTMDFLEYRKLKMFVHGGGTNSDSNQVTFNDDDRQIWMFFRFGADTTRNYYEYRQRVWPDWDKRNEIEIDLEQLPLLKRADIPDTLVIQNKDSTEVDYICVVGNPSISQVRQFSLGIIPVGFDADENDDIEVWFDELRVSDVKRDVGRKARASADLTLADLASVSVNMEVSDGDFHNVNTRVGSRQNSISGSATGSFQLHKFLDPNWGLSIPINANFSQSESVPYYFPNSDILVDESDPEQVDSVKTYSQSYGVGVDISKNTPSPSPWLKYTVDNLSGGYDYSYQESSNPTTLHSETVSNRADVSYNITFGRPSLAFLSWLKGVPVLKKYSDARLYYLITKLNLSVSGNESISKTSYRSGNQTDSRSFFLTKSISSGLRPFETLSIDWTRTHKADFLMDPENPKGVEDILHGDLGWSEDIDVNQTVSASYNPNFFSWLDSDFRYNTNYHWQWGQGYIESGQSISNSNTISASGTLKLTQILTPPQKRPQAPETPVGGRQVEPQTPPPETPPDSLKEGEPGDSTGTGEVGDTTRVLPVIEKPKRQSALLDFWYALRYTVSRLRDVRIDYTQQNNWSDPLVDGQAGIGYQLGLNNSDYKRIPNAAAYTGYSTRSRSDDYKFKSGLDFTRNFKIGLSYNYGWSLNESSSISGSISQSKLFFFKTGGDSITTTEIPIPDWSITWSGLEKTKLFENLAQTVTIENSYTGSKKTSWVDTRDNIKQHDFTRNFSPLLGINITWKGGVSSSIRYNWTESGTVSLYPTSSKSRTTQKNAQITASYTMKTGFKIPIPIWPFKNKRFKNSTTFSLTFSYSKSRTENEAEGKFIETSFNNTWSIKPSLDYTFSSTVSGGMHFEYGANKSKSQDSNYQEFGLRVNTTIRG